MAILLLMIPLRWILAAFLAAGFHELGHCLAVELLGGTILEANVSARGAKLRAAPMSPERELLCVLAGPAVSVALFGLRRLFPRIAVCALIQGVFNLLPIYPLDGGRAVRCLGELWSRKVFSVDSGNTSCKGRKHRVQ